MSSTQRTLPGADIDLTPDAAASALHIGLQASTTALTLITRGDFVAGLSAALAAAKAIQAGIDSLNHLVGTHG